MVMKNLKISAIVSIMTLCATFTTSCGRNINKVTAGSAAGLPGTGGGSGSTPVDQWKGIETEGYVVSGSTAVQVIHIDKVNKTLVVSMPLPDNPLGAGGRFDIKEMPGAYVEVSPDPNSSQWILSLVVPLKYVTKGLIPADPAKLPNGKPLPAIPGGELPRVAAHLWNSKGELFVYLSSTIFGVFIPTPGFDPYLSLTLPIKNKSSTKILGYLSSVPAVSSFAGGFFASFVVPPELSRIIDDNF